MSEVWNKVYKSDSSFFGEEPSNLALLCFNHMKSNNAKRILELGAGHGRDTTFFASNGIEVEALDYSMIAVDILDRIRKEKRLTIKPRIFYEYKGEAKRILQYITNDEELFQILWDAWKKCVWISDTNQYGLSITAFINNLLNFLDSTLKNRKSIEKERYELMESHIHYVASRAEELHP
jgi:hypothetical protein